MWPFSRKHHKQDDLTLLAEGRCPSCGGEMAGEERGLSYVLACKSCQWNVATTNYHHPAWDKTAYEIWIAGPVHDSEHALRDICDLWHVNHSEAKRILYGQSPAECGVSVWRVYLMFERCAVCGLKVKTKPDFPWNLEQNPIEVRKGPPCPYCGRSLASSNACQCFVCGTNWRDPSRVTRHGRLLGHDDRR